MIEERQAYFKAMLSCFASKHGPIRISMFATSAKHPAAHHLDIMVSVT